MPRLAQIAALLLVWTSSVFADGPDTDDFTFFESKIRPVLVEHCDACHSSAAEAANKLKGGLRLDSRAAILQGGDSGPAIESGDPDGSLLIEALSHEGVTRMPPKGKLSGSIVADFAEWVRRGAPDPRQEGQAIRARGIDLEAGREHWAYQVPRPPMLPDVADAGWASNAVDRFILARLESEGLGPTIPADRATLIRRVTFDLTGLPPTPEEIDSFLADDRPDAWPRLVDRLMASPRFGERWGRHWLDVARFGESLTLRGFVLKDAWRYRDHAIESFNDDAPFDRFLREQVAGDLLPADSVEDRRRGLVGTMFLTLGNTNLEEQDKRQLEMDVVDEQLDVLGKAVLGQTIACARCHDHKFDPIPTKDYYALAGILASVQTIEHENVSKWLERPLPEPPEREAALLAHQARAAGLEARIQAERERLAALGKSGGPIAAADVAGVVVDDSGARRVGDWQGSRHTGTYIGEGYLHDGNTDKGSKTLTFPAELPEAGAYEVRLAYSHDGGRARNVPVTVLSAEGETVISVDMSRPPPIDGRFVTLGRFRFETSGQHYVLISNEGTSGHVTADAVVFVPAEGVETEPTDEDDPRATLLALEAEMKRLTAEGPRRDSVMAVVERPEPTDLRVHVRGSVHNLGEPAPRGFLRVATIGPTPPLPSDASGRLELAEWMASAENPLTARVAVNRVWGHLLGDGLVRSSDNFGTTGEPPTHPELLDALAIEFTKGGWSIKLLVRQVVLSTTYRQSSVADESAIAADPENRRYGRSNRRRLEAEAIRDAMLVVSGGLEGRMGGPEFPTGMAADYGYRAESDRRSVYLPVFRNALPELFEAFDFADPSLVVGRRESSTVAPQALFLLNHPFAVEQAGRAARRLLAEPHADDASRLERAYRLTLGRSPTEAERAIAVEFLAASGEDRETAWASVVQALFASIDFRHVR